MFTGLMLTAAAATLGLAAALPAAPPAGVAISADQAVAQRQAAFRMSAVTFNAVKAIAESGDAAKATFPASGLAAWAKALPGAFPTGSNVAPTEALPTIWSDAAGFTAAATAYQNATGKLLAAAKANDIAGLQAALAETGKACGACHDSYRKPKPK